MFAGLSRKGRKKTKKTVISVSKDIYSDLQATVIFFLKNIYEIITHQATLTAIKSLSSSSDALWKNKFCPSKDTHAFGPSLPNNVRFDSIPILMENWRSSCSLLEYKVNGWVKTTSLI